MSTYKARKREASRFSISNAKFLATSALTAVGMLALTAGPVKADNWTDLTTTAGSTTTDLSQSNTTNIGLNTERAIMEGDLDITADWTVNVGEGNLVAIDRENDPTFIFGRLNCAGTCHVIDNNGIIVGETGSVDAASVTFSTANDINRDAFMNSGRLELSNFSDAEININEGALINVQEAGLAALVGRNITNNGTIKAKMGTVALAAGDTVTLDLNGDGLFEVAVEGEAADAYIENKGTIDAEGGRVEMTALAAKDAVDNLIKIDGDVSVASATVKGGKIVLSGGNGNVTVSGKLDASGEGGGDIKVTGENILVSDTAELLADGGDNGDGGNIEVIAQNAAIVRGSIYARGGVFSGAGGFVDTSGFNYIDVKGALVDTTAADGTAGTWLIDPTDITIVRNNGGGAIAVAGDTSTIGWDQIVAAMQLNNVIIETNSGGAGAGDITFAESFVYNGNATDATRSLTFNAERNIVVDAALGLSNIGSVNLNAADAIIVNENLSVTEFFAGTGFLNLDATRLDLGDRITATTGKLSVTGINTVNILDADASINQGVNLVQDGGVVNVAADTYNQGVTINKSVSLVGLPGDPNVAGADAGAALLQGTGSGAGINITGGTDVTVEGFRIDNFATGVQSSRGTQAIAGTTVNINNNTISGGAGGGAWGVLSAGVENVTVSNNDISGVVTGVEANDFGSNSANITDNVITGQGAVGFGVRVRDNGNDDTMHANIERNTITQIGIAVNLTDDDLSADIKNNFINNNSIGVFVTGADANGISVTDNDLSRNSVYAVWNGATTGTINASGNWFGTTDAAGVLAETTGSVDISPFLNSGTDTDLGTNGFQGDFSSTTVTLLGADTSVDGRINEAIDLASSGATINVSAGTYIESVDIDKSVSLLGAQSGTDAKGRTGVAETIITASSGLTNAITVNADNVTVDGFEVRGGISNIEIANGVSGTTLQNNILKSARIDGIYSIGANGVNLTNNVITGSAENGISLSSLTGANIVSGNEIDVDETGIKVADTDGITISNNVLHGNNDNEIAIDVSGGANVAVENNNIDDFGTGVKLDTVTGINTVSGNTATSVEYGVVADAVSGLTVSGNHLFGNSVVGIDVLNSAGAVVDGNDVHDFATGISVKDSGSNARIMNNLVENSETGILADNTANAWITNNDVNNSSVVGIHAKNTDGSNYGNDLDIWKNRVNSAAGATGILAEDSNFVTIGSHLTSPGDTLANGNVITGGADGIVVRGSDNAMLRFNTSTDATARGVYIAGTSTGAQILDNDINNAGTSAIASNGNSTTIRNNDIDVTGQSAIAVTNAANATIEDNFVDDAGHAGVYLHTMTGTNTVSGNEITAAGNQGVFAANTAGLSIQGNDITDAGSDGIYVTASNGTMIGGTNPGEENTITNSGDDGIQVNGSSGVSILNNVIAGTAAGASFNYHNGIEVGGSTGIIITGNTLTDIGWEGIRVVGNSTGAQIKLNDIDVAAGAGIVVGGNSHGSLVEENTVDDVGREGIYIDVDGTTIRNNTIDTAGFHGIVANTSDTVTIDDNTVSGVTGNGIFVISATGTNLVDNNTVFGTTNNGIQITGSSGVTVSDNFVGTDNALANKGANNIGRDGISINGSGGTVVSGNAVFDTALRGVNVAGSTGVTIGGPAPTDRNNILRTGSHGILVGGTSDGVTIQRNLIRRTGLNGTGNGILLDGLAGTNLVDRNTIRDAQANGIRTQNVSGLTADTNTINDTGLDGIFLFGGGNNTVQNNLIGQLEGFANIGGNGIHVQNGTGTNTIHNNTVDNTVQNNNLGSGIYGQTTAGLVITENKVGTTGGAGNIGGDGIELRASNGAQVKNNIIQNNADAAFNNGIQLVNSKNAIIQGNTISDIARDGIWATGNSTGALIGGATNTERNTIERVRNGIVVSNGSGDVTVQNNLIRPATGTGIILTGLGGTNLVDRNVTGNTGSRGIFANIVTNLTLSTNTINNAGGDGIEVNNSAGVQITGNRVGTIAGVDNIEGEGIDVNNSAGAQITGNEIENTESYGISINPSAGSTISGNTIYNTGDHAVYVLNSANSNVTGNFIGYSDAGITSAGTNNIGGDGIRVEGSSGTQITGNKIIETHASATNKGNGIHVTGSSNVVIGGPGADGNTVTNAGWDGIKVIGGNNNTIDDNDVTDSERAGIYASGITNSFITNNTVNGTNGFEGIGLLNGSNVTLSGNIVSNTERQGVYVKGTTTGITVSGNTIDDTANGDGIQVDNSAGVQILSNLIGTIGGGNNIRGEGINVDNSASAVIQNNTVYETLSNGISVGSSNLTQIRGNDISRAGNGDNGDGITVSSSDDIVIDDNDIFATAANRGARRHGISVFDGEDATINNNRVTNASPWFGAGQDGIHVERNANVIITNNQIQDPGGFDSVGNDGIFVDSSAGAFIDTNTVTGTRRGDGIHNSNSNGSTISNNIITDADEHGIHVNPSDDVVIVSNTIDGSGEDGIFVNGGNRVRIGGSLAEANTITNSDGDGIDVDNNADAVISFNTVDDTGGEGIEVSGSANARIIRNTISNAGDDGIDLKFSNNALIRRNTITNSDNDGIDIEDSADVRVLVNTIDGTGVQSFTEGNGIEVDRAANIRINGNFIDNTGTGSGSIGDGIDIANSSNARIRRNEIGLNGGNDNIDGHGIRADETDLIRITDNQIKDTDEGGIDVRDSDTIRIRRNTITNPDIDGITMVDVDGALVDVNTITNPDDDGIDMVRVTNARLLTNTINGSSRTDNGIEIFGSSNIRITDANTINNVGTEGIDIESGGSNDILIDGNFINDPDSDGIILGNGTFDVTISNNILDGNGAGDTNTTDQGIELDSGVTDIRIVGNTIQNFNDQGIEIDGNFGSTNQTSNILIDGNTIIDNDDQGIDIGGNVADITITGNTITGNGDEGILVDGFTSAPATNIIIDTNTIANNTDQGIRIRETEAVQILNNTITANGQQGLLAQGANNGDIVLTGNTFTNHDTGATFESGAIDLSGGGNSFVNTLGGTPVGMQFELANPADPTSLTITGATLGTTVFSGFTNPGSFYVRFEDGAILDTAGNVITIDGTDATYDGINPAATGDILSILQLAFIENRLFDADDAPFDDRGQIFVGTAFAPIDQEDIFRLFGIFDPSLTRLNLRVLGLPSTNIPQNFGGIQTFAGGDDGAGVAGIEPAAGDDGSGVADIEPAAGGETSCWGDVLNGVVNGAVDYTFSSGDMSDTLSTASACGVASL